MYNIPTEGNQQPMMSESTYPIKEAELHLFCSTNFVAKELQPNTAVNAQMSFLKLCGVNDSVSDKYNGSVKEVQKNLLHIIQQDLKEKLKYSQYSGIIVDENTDLSVHKKLVVYVRYVSHGEKKTELVGNIRFSDGKADTIYREILRDAWT